MKKTIIFIVLFAGLIVAGILYFAFSKNETQLKQTVEAGDGIFRVNNVGNSTIRFLPARTNQITLDFEGPEKELKKVRFFKVGSDTQFDLSDEWKNVVGTITVPEGTLIDLPDEDDEESNFIRLGGGSPYNTITINNNNVSYNDDGDGEAPATGPDDDQTEDQGGDDGGQTGGDAPPPQPSPPVEPNPVPPPPEEEPEEEEEPETTEYDPEEPLDPNIRCSIKLVQEERNICCQTVFADEPHPECAYTGYWLFNYNTRLCYYHCFHPCHVEPTEAERDQCCADEYHYDTTPPCIGNWKYSDATTGCYYECLSEEELEEYFGDPDIDYTDFVSEACSQHSNPDQCCDYNLKNELSIGPRPGFPDCIGKWEFETGTSKCEFHCADYGEMIEILEQLEEQADN